MTAFHLACELGLDEILPAMLDKISPNNINKCSSNDQTAFDLFLSAYLFSKQTLDKDEIFFEKFSQLFDLFVAKGAKLNHLTRAYRRTRAKSVAKILTIIFQKSISFSDLILRTNTSTIINDFQSFTCQSLADWISLIDSKDNITISDREHVLRQVYELFLTVYYQSPNRQLLNTKLLKRYCSANQNDSGMKQIFWLFLRSFLDKQTEPDLLKSICRKKVLLQIQSVSKHCTFQHLSISKDLEYYLLFFLMK